MSNNPKNMPHDIHGKLDGREFIAFFRSVKGRRGYKTIIQYHGVRRDGKVVTVDIVRKTTKTNATFGSHHLWLFPTERRRFMRAVDRVIYFRQSKLDARKIGQYAERTRN